MTASERRLTVLNLIDEGLACRAIAETVGCTYQRVCQLAKNAGTPLRTRRVPVRVRREGRFTVHDTDRPLCPKCSKPVQFRGFGKLGNRRTLCVRCRKSGLAGEPTRDPVKRDYEFWRRIGQMAAAVRWGGPIKDGEYQHRKDLFYPFHCSAVGENNLVSAVNNAVRRSLPEQLRADVCQEIICAILEGKLDVSNLSAELIEPYVKAEFRRMGWTISLDELSWDGKKTLGQRLGVY